METPAAGKGNRIIRFVRTVRTGIVCALFCLLAASGCAGTKPAAQVSELPANFTPARHLVFIGLDGWGGAYLPKADMATVKRMMAGGASSLDTRCVMPSNSWPNWTSLFSGTPPESRYPGNFPTIFTVPGNGGEAGSAVLFYEWGQLSAICPDDAAEKREIVSDMESAQKIAAYITEKKPVFTAVVFDEPDGAGHSKRWGSKAYYAKLAELDGFVAVIEQAIKDAGIYDDTVFVLSADHGGVFWGHGFNGPRQRKIPLVIYGAGIKGGYVIPSPVSICDIAPTMAVILGLETPPEWTGLPLLGIFK